jgi:hypothetical protein
MSQVSLLAPEDEEDQVQEQDVERRFYSKCKYPLTCGQALEELEFFKVRNYLTH